MGRHMRRLFLSLALALFAAQAFATSPTLCMTTPCTSPAGFGNTSSGNTTTTGTGTYTVQPGDDLIILLSGQTSSSSLTLSSITTSPGTLVSDLPFAFVNAGGSGIYLGTGIYRVHNSGASAQSYTITVTWSGGTSRWGMILADGSGISSVDGTTPAQNSGSGVNVTTNSVSATSGDLVIAFMGDATGAGPTLTWTAPFTSFASFLPTNIGMQVGGADDSPGTGSISAAATIGSSQQWAASIIAYSGAASSSCTNDGYEPSGGIIALPNGTSGSFLSCSGTIVTPNCSSVTYYPPSGGKCGVN